jgi:hypothetical protein
VETAWIRLRVIAASVVAMPVSAENLDRLNLLVMSIRGER